MCNSNIYSLITLKTIGSEKRTTFSVKNMLSGQNLLVHKQTRKAGQLRIFWTKKCYPVSRRSTSSKTKKIKKEFC